MKTKSITPLIAVLGSLLLTPAVQAAVTLTFDTTLQGFAGAGFGNSVNTTVAWSAVNGGSMEIASTKGAVGSEFAWIAKLFLNSSQAAPINAFYNELVLAVANGGKISYNLIVTDSSITVGGGAQPTFAQVNLFADNQNGGFDQEFNVPGFGSASFPLVSTISQFVEINIQTSGARVNDDDLANFLGSTGNMQVGFGSNYNNADGFKYYVDNFTVTAIPEPASAAILGLTFFGAFLRRRR